ncbi:MAG: methyl-accepting chemotaxis protein [Desulfovibrio sp.]|nr:methyl-accepting chemotaxis protein [Desulfovibrio sp.]
MSALLRSLRAKVLLLVSGLTIGAFATLFWANARWQSHDFQEMIQQASVRTADFVMQSIEEPMRLGKNAETTAQFKTMGEKYRDINVLLTNSKGNVTYSTRAGELRKNIEELVPDATFLADFKKSLASKADASELVHLGGKPYFVAIKSIPNEKSCHHCHGATRPILGSLAVFKDVSSEFATLTSNKTNNALLSASCLVVLLISLLTFMQRSVINRIKSIANSTGVVSKGNLDVSFNVAGTDELATLSADLGGMVHTMKNQIEYNKGILEGIIIPLFVADKDSNLEFVNPPLRAILGKKSAELMGKSVCSYLRDDLGNCLSETVIKSSKSISGKMRYKRPDGVEFPLHYEVSPLRNAADEVVGAIGVMIDLTREEMDRKRIEANQKNLLIIAEEVTSVSHMLNESAVELTRQMGELTVGVDNTADRTRQVATAMEEMNSTVAEVARTAAQTDQAAGNATKVAQEGGSEVRSAVDETRKVAQRANALAQTLDELSHKSQNIGRIMSVISDIADQTNLLALNAAIEAARAGEAGRGFAVVADEVRKLAEKTMTATTEVDQAVREIQNATQDAVREMTETKARVEFTAEKAELSGNVLAQIVGQSQSIEDMVRSIATAAEQQSQTSDEINVNVAQINQLSQDIHERITIANERITELAAMAGQLGELVEQFSHSEQAALTAE